MSLVGAVMPGAAGAGAAGAAGAAGIGPAGAAGAGDAPAGAAGAGPTGAAAGASPRGAGSGAEAALPPLLSVEGLEVIFPQGREGRWVQVVRGVSLTVRRGECVGLVGESGSGKSMLALAVLRLVPPPGRVRGRVMLDSAELPDAAAGAERAAARRRPPVDLLALPEAAMRKVRGARIGIVFQEPMTALNPFYTVGFQIAEAVAAHRPMGRRAARAEAARLLELVAIAGARRRLDDYPHQLSGGQRQRVLLAMALAGGPELLLADEPTTALDVTLQAQVLALLDDLRHDLGLAVLLITHDLAVVAETCDRVAVLYAGQVVEEADVADLFASPAHPYTRGLLATLPRLGQPGMRGRLPVLPGQPAEPAERPAGCAFHPRCPQAMAVCSSEEPPETAPADGPRRRVRCWLVGGG
jgi:oligopeptide/dipeptide ABC transporter ATP-binding protein